MVRFGCGVPPPSQLASGHAALLRVVTATAAHRLGGLDRCELIDDRRLGCGAKSFRKGKLGLLVRKEPLAARVEVRDLAHRRVLGG